MRRGRPGFSAVEFIVFTAMSLMLITYGYQMLRQGSIVGVTTNQGLALQQGLRNLMENLVRDVHAAVFIGEPNGISQGPNEPANRVVLWIFEDEIDDTSGMAKLGERLNMNGGPNGAGLTGGRNPWPFFHLDAPTTWGIPAAQVIYEWNASEKTVTRSYQKGAVVSDATQAGMPFVDKITFTTTHPSISASVTQPVVRVMAEHVDQFDVFPFGYNELKIDDLTRLGEIRPTHALPDMVVGAGAATTPVVAGFGTNPGSGGAVGTTERTARTAMLWVKILTKFDYKNPEYRDPEVFLSTKIWSHAKLYEHVYFPYFSSVDDDLRF